MEDGATPHARTHTHTRERARAHGAKETIRALRGAFGEFNGEDRIISKCLWPLDPQI
jgi:hypothetical protein